ncbi:5'-nucleotidase C-terminal domain-containing protein [Bifidobacterium avesanii]|uniref:5'-nucleotidase C-terminal domain-containing protein n=1 Tax=Bifidobacterium avesanii TaxID=1798157 RepID=UPI0013801A89|nr:5'-nucleotidase C-terminal domain-containing protein [Bifidobacterium avesanii]KAB8287555.1 5'-nucleotidase [Bifidobacterium avesanii]
MPRISRRLEGLLLSAAMIVPLGAIPAAAVYAADPQQTAATATAKENKDAVGGDIIKDEGTAVFLKRIDVGTDTVTLGSKNAKPVDISGWLIRDDKDSADHTYTVPAGTVIEASGEASFNLDKLAGIGLGKEDQVRVYDPSGKQLLGFGWSGDDKNAVYVANTDADGMTKEGDAGNPDQPSGEKLDVAAWPGLDAVTAIDGVDEFGAGQVTGEHTDGNLSGLAYQPGADGAPGTLWAADNDLNPTLGITGPKGPGAINKFVYLDGKWQQDPNDGWSFTKDGKAKGGKQLHFKDGKGGVDSEAITLLPGKDGKADPSKGVFVGAERDNEDKKVPRPSILSYDVTAKTADANGDGAQDLTATHEWNLVAALSQFGVRLEHGDDANLGVEGVAFVPDDVLTAKHFKVNLYPDRVGEYNPDGFGNDYGGLFFVALEKTNAIYAFALETVNGNDLVFPVSQFPLPEAAANAGYSGPRDLTWDAEHNQLLAEGDNTIGADEKPTKAMLATYEFQDDGTLALTKLTATPDEIASGNTEGFAITPDAEAATVAGGEDGKTYKPVFWADDGVTGGHSLRQGYIEAESTKRTVNLLNFNDFHGRIDAGLTVPFAATIQQLKGEYPNSSLLLAAGDNIGASLFSSSVQRDQPTIDVLNALGVKASAVGNHEFDQGYDDLVNRVITDKATGKRNAQWDYLGANVTFKDTGKPALPEYSIQNVNGVKVGVIGAVTQETSTLVSPGGIANLNFGDPVDAVNRVVRQLTDGDESNGEADVLVAEYHEGAPSNEDDETGKPTLDEQKAASPVFKEIVDGTDPKVDVIFTAHTHMKYSYTDPAKDGRPIIQTGSYAANVGQVVLGYDTKTRKVTYEKSGNVASLAAPEGTDPADFDAELAAGDATVAKVKTIVDDALKVADEKGQVKVGSVAADITTAFKDGKRDDRASESTLGNLVADSLLASLSSKDRGGAEIGVVNPGGLRAELCRTGANGACALAADGSITYAQANAVLPFLNNLWTTTLTGAQFKEALEQQWQLDADGNVPSRPYLQLGLSHNVSYTYDPNAEQGHHITSVTVNGEPLDPNRDYRIGSFSFLLQGGDNFRAFAVGKDTKDTGLVDRDAWIEYIGANSPLKPRYDRRAVAVTGVPADGTAVKAGDSFTLNFSKLTLTSLGVPAETRLVAKIGDAEVGQAAVKDDAAALTVTVPAGLASGDATLVVTGQTDGTVVTLPITVAAQEQPNQPNQPGKVDRGKLQAAVDAASALKSDGYTKESWDAFAAALADAKKALSDQSATQQRIDAAADALTKAQSGLKRAEAEQPGGQDVPPAGKPSDKPSGTPSDEPSGKPNGSDDQNGQGGQNGQNGQPSDNGQQGNGQNGQQGNGGQNDQNGNGQGGQPSGNGQQPVNADRNSGKQQANLARTGASVTVVAIAAIVLAAAGGALALRRRA